VSIAGNDIRPAACVPAAGETAGEGRSRVHPVVAGILRKRGIRDNLREFLEAPLYRMLEEKLMNQTDPIGERLEITAELLVEIFPCTRQKYDDLLAFYINNPIRNLIINTLIPYVVSKNTRKISPFLLSDIWIQA